MNNPYESSSFKPREQNGSNRNPTPLEQLEDALLKYVPSIGVLLGGCAVFNLIGQKIDGLPAFAIGGAIGAVIVYLPLAGLFRLINPT